jgi:hypothetical protein
MATKKKTTKKSAPKKSSKKKKVKAKKGSEYVCRLCGRIETLDVIESFDGVYGYVETSDLICCGEEMKTK